MLSYKKHYPPCHMNALLALRPCKAFGRSTSGIHARPLSKVRCCRPKKIRATTGGIALHPPAFQSPQPSQKHINRFAPHHVLASPRKRGSGTAVEVFRLAVQYSDSPALTILELFRAVTVGIAPHPHQPSQTRTIPLAFRR